MGLRQPTATGAFFAQAKAGAQQQEEARKKLQKPQALGGSAAVGTQMVAAQTQAQQGATQQVKTTTQQAGKDLTVNPTGVGTGMVSTVGGASTTFAAPGELKVASGETGDVEAVEASGTAVRNAIDAATKAKNDLDIKLQTAEGEDRKRLLDERNRLDALLKSYQEKRSKENLGEIAGPSEFEQQMTERERLLAEQGQNVGKLAALFGPGWSSKYGGLESQIYGKDLEAIQEAAGAGLQAKERAERESEAGLEQYEEQLKTGQKSYTETLDKESKKLDLLKATPQELVGYTKDELTKLFGKDVDKLFTFDANGKVVSTKSTETRKALEDRLTQLGTEKEKIGAEVEKAKTVREEEFKKVDKEVFGDVNNKGLVNNLKEEINTIDANATRIVQKIDEITSSMFAREWKGISRDSSIALSIKRMAEGVRPAQTRLIQQMEKAKADKNTAELKRLGEELRNINKNLRQKINEEWSKMTENARRL